MARAGGCCALCAAADQGLTLNPTQPSIYPIYISIYLSLNTKASLNFQTGTCLPTLTDTPAVPLSKCLPPGSSTSSVKRRPTPFV